jgi:hypothetical protein
MSRAKGRWVGLARISGKVFSFIISIILTALGGLSAIRVIAPLALAFALALAPRPLAAKPPPDPWEVQPERPTVATHAGTVAPGWAEIESGIELDRYADRSRGAEVVPLLKIGLAPRLQLSIQAPIVRPPGAGATHFGDAFVGVKWRLAEDLPLLGDFAVLPGLKLPSGTTRSGAGTGTTDASLLLISSHVFGPVAMDVNLGYTRRSGTGLRGPGNATLWTTALGGPVHGELGWAAEIYGYPGSSGPVQAAPLVAFLAGPTWQPRDWLVLDAGVILPLSGPQPHAYYAGVTWNAGKLWHP